MLVNIRFFDLVPELTELGGRELSIMVVVESLDEMQRPLLRIVELIGQNGHCFVEADAIFSTVTNVTQRNVDKISTKNDYFRFYAVSIKFNSALIELKDESTAGHSEHHSIDAGRTGLDSVHRLF